MRGCFVLIITIEKFYLLEVLKYNPMNREANLLGHEKEDEAIRRILVKILDKWCGAMGMRREELEKTSLISPGGVGKEPPPSSIEVKKPEEVMAETVRILPQRMTEETSISSSEVKSKEVDLEAIPETVMITPQGMTKGNSILSPADKSKEADLFQKNKEPPMKDEFLEETVILKPSKVRDKVNE